MAKKNILLRSKRKKAATLLERGQLNDARVLLEQIVRQSRMDPDAWYLLGVLAGKQRRFRDAADSFRKALVIRPAHAGTHYNLGVALRDCGDFQSAIEHFREAIRLQPGYLDACDSLAHACMALGRLDEAAAAFRDALCIFPSKAELHSNLGSVFQAQGLLEEAVQCYREALRLNPALAVTYDSLGSALSSQGKFSEALACYQESLRRYPSNARARSNLLLTLNYIADKDRQSVFEAHQAWDKAHGRVHPPRALFANSRDPDRVLRIGYVSPDFRTHSVAYYVEPLLAAHDKSLVETVCYSGVPNPDETTRRLRGLADRWRDISKVGDDEMAAMVREDGIDILVDLAGHTSCNRLPVFARKPAPVQVTWLGYPNTTGLSTIDYRLTDAIADPDGQGAFHSEKLVRLPGCFLCYQPLADAPPVAPLPAAVSGHITFGSFNNLAKISPGVVELWSELLKALPAARLVIKNPSLTDTPTRQRYYELFAQQGLAEGRIELLGHTASREEHLALYGRVDIGLDTFPYNGTTTTCEALWMGVPVIALAGHSHAGRVGMSLLTAAGLQEWIANTPEQYIEIAQALAADADKLAQLRAGLRQQLAASLLCDGSAFAARVEAAYRKMWHGFCAAGH